MFFKENNKGRNKENKNSVIPEISGARLLCLSVTIVRYPLYGIRELGLLVKLRMSYYQLTFFDKRLDATLQFTHYLSARMAHNGSRTLSCALGKVA
jgi:hypothetical protein